MKRIVETDKQEIEKISVVDDVKEEVGSVKNYL